MLEKARRLRAAEVREVLARGRGRRGTVLSSKLLASPPPFRCAVVVSKKVAKTAVERNRLRRTVYRELHRSSLPPAGHAILFVQSAPQAGFARACAADITKLLHV